MNILKKGGTDMIDEALAYNKQFVANKEYEKYITDKYPDRKIAILSCMDTRLTELLPAALGFKNGDVKIIKNAGGIITQPFGSAVRSLLVAIYELGVEEIMVIAHTDCGVQCMDGAMMIEHMQQRGISEDHLKLMDYCGIDLKQWLSGFHDTEEAVRETLDIILNHPLIPQDIKVRGFIMNSVTGELAEVEHK